MSDHDSPSPTEHSGRGTNGRFQPGNRLGKGNPLNRRAQRIRAELLRSANGDDVKNICRKLVENAKAGDLHFIREWLDRTIGKPVSGDVEARLAELAELVVRITKNER